MNDDYIRRINKVLVYIEENLKEDLSLEVISGIACYSPFHLHRLFRAITKETLNAYVTRKRIEKTAIKLVHNKNLPISEIAFQNGFGSISSYSRTFAKFYGQSPTNFRKMNVGKFSKIGKVESKNGKQAQINDEYLCNINHLKNWIVMNSKIEIKQMPQIGVACLTQIGIDGLDTAFARLLKWAKPRNLLSDKDAKVVRIFHDSFKVTDADKVRMSIGVTIKNEIITEGEIGLASIGGGRAIVGRFEIEPLDFEESWDGLFIWMNENGYKKGDSFPFEIYHNNYQEHPQKKCVVDLCIPVV